MDLFARPSPRSAQCEAADLHTPAENAAARPIEFKQHLQQTKVNPNEHNTIRSKYTYVSSGIRANVRIILLNHRLSASSNSLNAGHKILFLSSATAPNRRQTAAAHLVEDAREAVPSVLTGVGAEHWVEAEDV